MTKDALSPPQRRDFIDVIRALPEQLTRLVTDLDDVHLGTPYGEGKWTIRQVVHHLADSHCNAYSRFRWVLTEDNTTIKPYDQDRWAELPDARGEMLQSSLIILTGLHRRWVSLAESLPEEAWARTAHHPEDGDVTLDDLLAVYAEHCTKHLDHIRQAREKYGW